MKEYRFTIMVEADTIGEAWSNMDEIVTICAGYGVTGWKEK